MKGTEKQIAWAEDIKSGIVSNIENLRKNRAQDVELGLTPEYSSEAVDVVEKEVKQIFQMQDEAKFYIENRERLSYDALKKTCREWDRFNK